MSRTIAANYSHQLQLTATSDSPVSIAQGVSVIDGNGVAVFAFAGDWTIYNAGVVQETSPTGGGIGLYLQKSSAGLAQLTLTNQSTGQISGNQFGLLLAGAGTIDNRGAIIGDARDGIRIADGGSVENETGASIAGNNYGILIYGGLGSVTNQSTITGATKDGVLLLAGGTVANNAASASIGGGYVGVSISGAQGTVSNQGLIQNHTAFTTQTFVFGGVMLSGGGSVTNSAGGAIIGTFYGVWAGGATATVSNTGAIAGSPSSAGAGVALILGGTVTNNSGATIAAGLYGVRVLGAAGSVANFGSIASSSTAAGAVAVALSAGGSVGNHGHGTISAGTYGVRLLNVAGAVYNAGLIASVGTSAGAAIDLRAGGSVTNTTVGTLSAGFFGVVVSGGAGTVSNAGTITSTQATAAGAVVLLAGGEVINSAGGTISGGSYGIRMPTLAGTTVLAGTVINSGSISSALRQAGGAVVLGAGGAVTNNTGGTITSGAYGVRAIGGAGTVTNAGLISGAQTSTGAGVNLMAGGAVSNSGGATISASYFGVLIGGAAGSVTNAGLISSAQTSVGAGIDLMAGGTVTNSAGGMIASPWIGVQIGQRTASTGGTFVNQGSVFAGDAMGDGAAVWVHGPGVVVNDTGGMIDTGPFNGVARGGFGVVTYFQTTVINRGSIGGTTAIAAVNAGFGNLVEMTPGASFGGLVQGAQSATDAGLATLELQSGASAGTISGFGPKYQNFGHVTIDAGARWTLGGTVAEGTSIGLGAGAALTFANPSSMQGTIDGFTIGDTLALSGITVTGSSYAGGVLTLTDASGAVDLNLPGSFTSNQIAVTNVAGVGATVGILPVRTLGWVGGSGTAFGMAANWNDLTNGLDPAQMGPDAADTVDFDSSNGAVDGPGTVAALDIGTTGNGVLQLSSGTIVTGTLDAGIVLGSDGQLGLTGAGTELMVTGSAAVADDGTGVLSVLSGATFAAQSLTIGSQTDSSGALVVSGSGSLLSISGQLNIGTALGTGDLTVGPGATVNAAVVNLQGGVVLEGGVLDPTVYIENGGSTTGGFGTIASDFILLEGTILSNGSKSGKQTEVVEGTLVGGGTADIKGSVSVNGPGILQIGTHDTIELTGAVLNAATTTFTDNLTPTGTYTVNNSVIDVVFQDTTGLLQLDNIGGFAGTIATWHAGDAFVATGETLSNPSVSNGDTLLVQDTGPNAGAGGIDTIIFASAIDAGGFSIVNGNTLVACFAAGTRIETADGPVAVEDLRVRDSVVTMTGAGFHRGTGQASTDRVATDGHAPIVWIGQRRVNCLTHPAPETVWPVVVRAGALGPRQPARDLYLSPDHALFVNHVLVPVKLLINGTSIAQVERPSVTYYHIELPRHAVILAEGLPVESYLDAGDRANFRPDEKTIRLQPNFAPRLTPDSGRLWETRGAARLIVTGPELAAARRTVTRAGEISARAAAATVPARAQSRPAAGR